MSDYHTFPNEVPVTIPPKPFMSAYIQGDWSASQAANSLGYISSLPEVNAHLPPANSTPELRKAYSSFLLQMESIGVQNNATWHTQAVGTKDKNPRTDVLRNFNEINASNCVITYLQQDKTDKNHWGSLSCMSYAIGRGIPSILICSKANVIRESHVVQHPLITMVETVDEAVAILIGTPN